MKLSKAVLGAVLIGLTVQTTSCVKKENPEPKGEKGSKESKTVTPNNCPGCGMG